MLKYTKRAALVLLSVILLLGATVQAVFIPQEVLAQSNENLISNPGFESDWTGWQHGVNASIDTTTYRSGLKSLKMTGVAGDGANRVSAGSSLNVVDGQQIRLDVYSKDTMTKGVCLVGIRFADELGNTILYDYFPLKSSNTWIKQGKTFTVPNNNFKLNPVKYGLRMYVYLWMPEYAAGSTWIDDIEVSADNLAADPGFELNNASWSGNITYETNTANIRTGAKSAKITGNSSAFNEFHSASFIDLDEEQFITLIANTKDTLLYKESFNIGFGFYNSSQALIAYSWQKNTNKSSWSANAFTAKSPAGTRYAKVFFWVSQNATGNVWVDDVVVQSPNILLNPGFEGSYANWNQRATTLDSTTFYKGTKAAKFTGDSANSWNVLDHANLFMAKPGDNLMLKSYVKSGLTAGTFKMGLRFVKEDRTTSIGYSWYTIPLSANWTESNEIFVTPPETAYVQVYFLLSQDAVGNVWVDNALLSNVADSLKLTLSEEHGWSTDSKIMAKFDVNLSRGSLADYKVKLERYDFGGAAPVYTREYLTLKSSFADYFDVSDLPLGYSIYKASLIKNSDSSTLQTVTQEFLKADKYFYPVIPDTTGVTIDANKSMELNGSAFLPRYMYHVDPSDYLLMKESGFNAVQTVGTNLDACQLAGLKGLVVLYHNSQPDIAFIQEQVTLYKDHPAVLAWLLNDEPDGAGISGTAMQEAYNAIRAIDTNHPVVLNTCYENPLTQGTYNAAMDICSQDPYPVGNVGYVKMVSERVDAQVNTGKMISSVIQAFGNYGYWTIPSAEQVRAMTYLAINHGAKAIGTYVNDDYGAGYLLRRDGPQIWASYKVLNQELESMKEVICAADVTQNISSSSTDIDVKVKEYGGYRYLFAVNTTSKDISSAFTGTGLSGKTSAQAVYENRAKAVSGGSFTDTFSPYMVHIYKLMP